MRATYPAEMFRAGSGARAVSGELTVEGRRMVFVDEESGEIVEFPLSGLVCRLSGYDNRTFFFSHPDQERTEIAVKDQQIRRNQDLAPLPVFQEAQRVGRATHLRFWSCIGILVATALAVLAAIGVTTAFFIRWLLSS